MAGLRTAFHMGAYESMASPHKSNPAIAAEQLRILVDQWPKVEILVADVIATIAKEPDRLLPLAGPHVHWCRYYEMSFNTHLANVLSSIGLLADSTATNALGLRAGELIGTIPELLSEVPSRRDKVANAPAVAIVLAQVTSVLRSIESLLTYGLYLNELVARARTGDDNSLLKALRIDRTVICGPTGAARLSMAVLRGDTKFQADVAKAWSQKVGARAAANYRKMRLVLRVLAESGAGRLSDAELENLFVKSLGLYAPGPSAQKNLRKFVDRYLQDMATT